MKIEWDLFFPAPSYRSIGWFLLITILLSSDCASAPVSVPPTYDLIEPLGTVHKYRKEPLVGKSYYCIIHEYPETVYVVDDIKRVRRWSGYDWR